MKLHTRQAPARYDSVAMGLHWLIALLILLDFALAMSFSRFNPGDVWYFPSAYDLHMAFGLSVLLLSLVRVGWRLAHPAPPLPGMSLGLRALARTSHLLLYVFMLAAPLSGWFVLSLRHQTTSVFGLFHWAWPTLPTIATLARPERQLWHDQLLSLHIRLSYLGMCLAALHVAAALYHHFRRRDHVLLRMLPRAVAGTGVAPELRSESHS